MHKIMDKRNLMKLGNVLMKLKRMLKQHAGQIGYYACVVLVLAAVAMAAERLRSGKEPVEALILPAVELAEPVREEADAMFELPEGMEAVAVYASQPEWSSAHRQWETHAAVDFVCEDDAVRSFSEGIVRTVGRSGVYGGFIEVETGEYMLRYCSVTPEDEIVPGKKLKKGETVGKTNDSMSGESHAGPHLHLELWENAVSRNIMELIGKNF